MWFLNKTNSHPRGLHADRPRGARGCYRGLSGDSIDPRHWVEHRPQAQLSFSTSTTIILQVVDIYPIIQDAAERSP